MLLSTQFNLLLCVRELKVLVIVKCDCQHAHVSRGEVIGLLGGTFDEENKVLKVSNKNSFNFFFFNCVRPLAKISALSADLRGRTVQQREHRHAVWDGPGLPDSGLRRALLPGLQRGGLVPLAPLLPPQPVRTRHQHTGPVAGRAHRSVQRFSNTESTIYLFSPDCCRATSPVVEPRSSGW